MYARLTRPHSLRRHLANAGLLQHDAATLIAGNSDSHSQLRVWDVRGGADGPRERFSLPAHVRGVRCIASLDANTFVCGTTNGWVMHVDLRTGRYERKFAHADCINGLVAPAHHLLVSGGDDGYVRITDLRKCSFAPLGTHRLKHPVFSLAADAEAIYAGVDGGDIRTFDYSAAANPAAALPKGADAGGFTAEQKAALAQAVAGVRRRAAASGAT